MNEGQKKKMLEAAKNDPDLKGLPLKKRWVLFCLKLSKGIVSSACTNAGISRRAFYDWYGETLRGEPNPNFDPLFKEIADDIRMITHEWVESKLLQNIDNNDEKAIEFYLSNNYREKYATATQKIDHTNDGGKFEPNEIVFLSADQMTEEEIEKYKKKHLHQ
ncbi:hypothetical protein [Sphingobacterium thalpophilum]|uniref:hypothetical protein n=1 Tax=Sphingobacterium thalpophilum TaxID=259 RepID=UPI003D98F750